MGISHGKVRGNSMPTGTVGGVGTDSLWPPAKGTRLLKTQVVSASGVRSPDALPPHTHTRVVLEPLSPESQGGAINITVFAAFRRLLSQRRE